MQAFDIKKNCYAMASRDGAVVEITMYGDIYETQPVDWWTGEPIPGMYILLDEFMDDLELIDGAAKLIIRMNSYGGDAVVATTIHNRIREFARSGMETICIVDGVAMSGGSLIMCACDEVEVNPSSLIMIHEAWLRLDGGYNRRELQQLENKLDAADRMQIATYQQKTGISEAELRGMMEEVTYMTGREAVEKGFADRLIEDAEPLRIAASADRHTLFVGARTLHLAPGMTAPDTLEIIEPPDTWKARMLDRIKKIHKED